MKRAAVRSYREERKDGVEDVVQIGMNQRLVICTVHWFPATVRCIQQLNIGYRVA